MFLLPGLASADSWPELQLLAEHPVDGMRGGNLSGLAMCGGVLWTESDRDDDQIYQLNITQPVFKAQAQTFKAPTPPDTGLPLMLKATVWAASWVRGGSLDFEAISCDAAGNRYLASEGYAAVLKVTPSGVATWLDLAPEVIAQARAAGLLQKFNAIFEGLAVDPSGERLWLAAEREKRGLLAVHRVQGQWGCAGNCVMLSEGGLQAPPPQMTWSTSGQLDFSDLVLYHDKLFTLERYAHRVCRRNLDTAAVEACWSFAASALTDARRYDVPYGLAEALVIDEAGAWIGVDNNFLARHDGESRPIVWRFAAPAGGWDAAATSPAKDAQ